MNSKTHNDVKVGLATIIGYASALVAALVAAADALTGTGLSNDGELLLKIATVLAAVVSAGRQFQAGLAQINSPKLEK